MCSAYSNRTIHTPKKEIEIQNPRNSVRHDRSGESDCLELSAPPFDRCLSLLGVGTVLRLEKDAWSTVKRLMQATKRARPPPPSHYQSQETAITTRYEAPSFALISAPLSSSGFVPRHTEHGKLSARVCSFHTPHLLPLLRIDNRSLPIQKKKQHIISTITAHHKTYTQGARARTPHAVTTAHASIPREPLTLRSAPTQRWQATVLCWLHTAHL